MDALLFDSLREIGAAILDTDERSASLYQAVRLVNARGVLEAIKKDYSIVPPVRHLGDDLTPALLAEIDAHLRQEELKRNYREFDELHSKIVNIKRELFDASVTSQIRKARNKAVAHYDVRKVGPDWKTVTIGDAGLTFGDMDAYFEKCTEAVKVVTLFVHRKAMNFAASREIYEKRVAEYIDAIVRGRGAQRSERDSMRKVTGGSVE
jgi:hypothetical protein